MIRLLLPVLAAFLTFTPAWLQDPCVTNTDLLSDSTRGLDHKQRPDQITNGFCDISLKPGWYRLKMGSDDADLATSAPKLGACNTRFPIWMNGTVPSVLNQQTETIACIVASSNNPCAVKLPVKVKNCGQYRVYELQPTPFCSTAYCFSNFPTIVIKPEVAPILGNSTVNPASEDLRFECRFISPNPNYFYDIVWRINGAKVAQINRKSGANLPLAAQLLEPMWTTRYKLGMNVQCSVRVRYSANEDPSPEHHSQQFFAGLKVLNPAVDLKEGESVIVQLQSTVPVPCQIFLAGKCTVRFIDLRTDVNDGCKTTEKANCGFELSAKNWMAIHELTVTAKFDGMFGSRISQLFLTSTPPAFSAPNHVWADVKPQPVVINIIDEDALTPGSYCTLQNDPHFRSFDGRRFDVQMPGEFVLYRHKTLPIEVRGYFQLCGTIPYCICGAAVRSGEQIFVFSTCKDNLAYQTTRVRVYGCNRNQMRVTTSNNGTKYKVELPTGLAVEIRNGYIKIIPSPADVGQVTGLCGNFNGNAEDEYIDPNGIRHSNDCDFFLFNRSHFCVVNNYGSTWRIKTTKESYYGYPDIDLDPAQVGECHCTTQMSQISQEVNCSRVSPQQCGILDPVVTDEYCTQIPPSSARRRKRQVENSDGLNDDDVRPVFPLYTDTEFTVPKWINGWNEQKARQHCVRFFQRSPAFQPCSKVSNLEMDLDIHFCTIDVLLSGTTEWTLAALESFKHNCRSEVRRNTTLWIRDNSPSVLDQVMGTSCPNECSFNGNCVMGECQCEAGWIGDDCSIDINTPPEVLGLPKGGLCDFKTRKCDRTVVYGSKFAASDNLTCKFEYDLAVRESTPYYSKAVFRHSGEVVCPTPLGLITNDTDEPRVYHISVSNNNRVFSQPKLFLPFHSDDFACNINGLNFSCRNVQDQEAFLLHLPNSVRLLLCRNGESVRFFQLPPGGDLTRYEGFCSLVNSLKELEPSTYPTDVQIAHSPLSSVKY
ncbi:von Willebrand factor D and EGF domain-containing protein-like [Liolophura sinensis]|uniref:von Willebrand factor D and EGF domain-containing protein-like n=1 Tax=Liolophura sinensis TaxID=3198878 RepID=UPI0031590F65